MPTPEERLISVRVKEPRQEHVADLEMAAEEYRDAYIHVVDRDAGYGMRKLPIIHFDMLAIAGDALRFARRRIGNLKSTWTITALIKQWRMLVAYTTAKDSNYANDSLSRGIACVASSASSGNS